MLEDAYMAFSVHKDVKGSPNMEGALSTNCLSPCPADNGPCKNGDELPRPHYESDKLCCWSQDGHNWIDAAPSTRR